MKTKYVCHGLISPPVNFHNNWTKWTVTSNIKICRWGGDGKRAKRASLSYIDIGIQTKSKRGTGKETKKLYAQTPMKVITYLNLALWEAVTGKTRKRNLGSGHYVRRLAHVACDSTSDQTSWTQSEASPPVPPVAESKWTHLHRSPNFHQMTSFLLRNLRVDFLESTNWENQLSSNEMMKHRTREASRVFEFFPW